MPRCAAELTGKLREPDSGVDLIERRIKARGHASIQVFRFGGALTAPHHQKAGEQKTLTTQLCLVGLLLKDCFWSLEISLNHDVHKSENGSGFLLCRARLAAG